MVMSLDQKSVHKLSLGSFCMFNTSFLNLMKIASQPKYSFKKPYVSNLVERTIAQYYFFNLNFFGVSPYTTDSVKQNYMMKKMHDVELRIKELTQILQDLNILLTVHKKENIFSKPIYDEYYKKKGILSHFNNVYLAKWSNSFTIKSIEPALGVPTGHMKSKNFFLNLLPGGEQIKNKFSVKSILQVISYFIADEIDNIKANFFTRLSKASNLFSVETNKLTSENFKYMALDLFSLNPITSLHFVNKFAYTVCDTEDAQQNLKIEIFGKRVEN